MWTGRYVTYFFLCVTVPSSWCCKCGADLPESLRLGRVQVSCEGWTGPGDSHVLKGEQRQCLWPPCSHTETVFRILLSRVPPPRSAKCLSTGLPFPLIRRIFYMYVRLISAGKVDNANRATVEALMNYIFYALLIGVVGLILYKFLRPCFEGRNRVWPPQPPRPGPSSNYGWFPRGHDDPRRPPPPPYSKYPTSTDSSTGSPAQDNQDRFGFWSGAALGGLGTYLLTRQRAAEPQPRRYDWEEDRYFARPDSGSMPRSSGSSSRQQPLGSPILGPTRRSTGYGGSSVR